MSEYRLSSASVAIHQPDATLEDLIDVIEGNRYARLSRLAGFVLTLVWGLRRVYIPAIFVLNKIDAISIEELDLLYKVSRSHGHDRLWPNIVASHRFPTPSPSGMLIPPRREV
jgi:ribosome-interacting GTPase 1